ncbi:MAG: DEAD/DEAH box helicase domain protein [Proteiniphilum sp. 51_7]|nr:MAG: DEAD/DEAH box helicase domain protein [Proteiniphilum sp. 51_7]
MLFTDLPLCDSLLDGLQAMNFKETTPIQEQAIPVILQKRDLIACAQTGTGKTAAFLLPLLNNLQTEPHEEHKVNAIIMAPTRELAQQIDQQMEGFSYFTPFSSVAVYGGNDGEAWEIQKRGLTNGADVVVATPGRLLSHINLYNIDFSGVKYFILDEADRMLDMGFFDDIMKIERLLPKERQTIMFSATMPPKIQQLAKTILHDPEEISISITRPPDTIMQSAYLCYESQKMQILRQLFKEKKPKKVLLFSGSKMKVKEITKLLRGMGLSAGEMHSDLDQAQRDSIMHEFRNERVDILVATDIVARGIDIDDITLVINFEAPYDVEDYVHRIGRTARAGDTGMAITFVSPDEQYRLQQIERFLGKEINRIPLPEGMGESPEYNPTREARGQGRGGSVRSGKGGGRREGDGKRKLQGEAAIPGEIATVDASAAKQTPRRKNNKQQKKRKPQGEGAATTGGSDEKSNAPRQGGEGSSHRRSNHPPRKGGEGAPRREGGDRGERREGSNPEGRRKEGSNNPRNKRPQRRTDAPSADRNSGKPQRQEANKPAAKEQKTKKPGILSWLFGRKK